MRNAIQQQPEQRTPSEQRQVLRAAIRQLERADVYLTAAVYMELDDWASERTLNQIRTDLDGLRRHLSDERARITG
jgi:hypothetical protein